MAVWVLFKRSHQSILFFKCLIFHSTNRIVENFISVDVGCLCGCFANTHTNPFEFSFTAVVAKSFPHSLRAVFSLVEYGGKCLSFSDARV